MKEDPPEKRSQVLRLLIFVAAVLALPAVVCQFIPLRARFDKRPLAQLRSHHPDVVILSDSMVDNGVDPGLLGRMLKPDATPPLRVELLWYGGASSASWFFQLKNYVIASGIRPKLVVIFFRDRMLTDARFRTEGTYRAKLEAAMHEDEPAYRSVLGSKDSPPNILAKAIAILYPLDARRYAFHQYLEETSMRFVADFGLTVPKVRRAVNRTFAISNMARGALDEAAGVTQEQRVRFDPDPAHSFLPHMIEAANEAQLRLCFVRVKRYADAEGKAPEAPELREYITSLRAWVESHGAFFVDDTGNAARTREMFLAPGDDHMGPWAKQRSTELYAEKLRPLLPP